jgi:hypothetical protein
VKSSFCKQPMHPPSHHIFQCWREPMEINFCTFCVVFGFAGLFILETSMCQYRRLRTPSKPFSTRNWKGSRVWPKTLIRDSRVSIQAGDSGVQHWTDMRSQRLWSHTLVSFRTIAYQGTGMGRELWLDNFGLENSA